MLEVPLPLSLEDGRRLLDTGQTYFDAVREASGRRDTAIHTLMMVARQVAPAIEEVARERHADLIVLGTRGQTRRGRIFGRTADPLLANPPADLAVMRPADKPAEAYERILVPVMASENSKLAVRLALDIALVVAGRKKAQVTLLHVVPTKADVESAGDPLFAQLLDGVEYRKLDARVVQGASIANTIIAESENHDLVIFGATEEPLLKKIAAGSLSRRILRGAKPATVMVKRRHPKLHSLLRRALLP